jgi:hypothetical protein
MEGSCSTGQSPQWAVVPVEEEEEELLFHFKNGYTNAPPCYLIRILPVSVYIIWVGLGVSRRSVITETRVRSQVSPYEICGGQVTLGQVFLRVVRYSPATTIPPTLHTHLQIHITLTRTSG